MIGTLSLNCVRERTHVRVIKLRVQLSKSLQITIILRVYVMMSTGIFNTLVNVKTSKFMSWKHLNFVIAMAVQQFGPFTLPCNYVQYMYMYDHARTFMIHTTSTVHCTQHSNIMACHRQVYNTCYVKFQVAKTELPWHIKVIHRVHSVISKK